MKKIINSESLNINEPYIWEFSNKRMKLKNAVDTITVVKSNGKTNASFRFNEREFRIKCKGFWNNIITVYENDNIRATIRRSFFGKTLIIFENGNSYQIKVKNQKLVKLSISSTEQKDFILYRMVSKYKTVLKLNPAFKIEDPIEFLILIVMSGFVFKTILKELKLFNLKDGLVVDHKQMENIPAL